MEKKRTPGGDQGQGKDGVLMSEKTMPETAPEVKYTAIQEPKEQAAERIRKAAQRIGLDAYRQWVCWKLVQDPQGGKPSKVPVGAKSKINASSTDPTTWGTLEEALLAFENTPWLAGVGFVFSERDPFTGTDVDHMDPESEEARRIRDPFKSYAETSPSGDGFHSLARGVRPARGYHNKKGDFESYDRARFFTFTGQALNDYGIEEAQEAINTFHEKYLKKEAKPRQATPAPTSGQTTPYGRRALEQETTSLMLSPEGTRNDSLNTAAFALGQLVAGGEIAEAEALEALEKAGAACGLSEGETAQTIKSGFESGKQEPRSAPQQGGQVGSGVVPPTPKENKQWKAAREVFPKRPTPWHLFPSFVADSLQQLARSCATSNTSLPGTALAVLGSALGRTIEVSPKVGWKEPLILWVADIRKTGQGKTPLGRALIRVFYKRQQDEHERFEWELEEFRTMTAKEQKASPKPEKPRGYFVTELTIEALRDELADHPTGGLLVLLDELSTFVSGQNQYKSGGKGSDREAWLCLHDGNPARTIRAGKSVFIAGSRIQLCGGIQPEIFRTAFSGDQGGKFQHDGTLYRFLTVFEPPRFAELTRESWTEENQNIWAAIITAALEWAEESDGITLLLSEDAQDVFFDWRNEVFSRMEDLPDILRGYLPKAVGYALRLAGLLWALRTFAEGKKPRETFLDVSDIKAGIELVEWFTAHAVDAVYYLARPEEPMTATDVSPRAATLAKVLKDAEPEIENGRLGLSWLKDRFNESAAKHDRFGSPHAFGAYVRSVGLSTSAGLHDFKEKRRIKCLVWDEKTTAYAKQCLQSLQSLQTQAGQGLGEGDIEKPKSPLSPCGGETGSFMETMETSKNNVSIPGTQTGQDFGESGEKGDIVSSANDFFKVTGPDVVEF